VVQRSFQVGNLLFGIRTTSMQFCDWLDHTLGAYQVEDETDPYYSIVIGGGENNGRPGERKYHILYRGASTLVRTLHLPTVGRALLTEIESLTFPERDDRLYLDFGLVASNGATALLPSAMITTVATLGRRVARAGIRLPANGSVAVDPSSGQVIPIPRTLDVPEEAVTLLADGEPEEKADRLSIGDPLTPDLVFMYYTGEQGLQPVSRGQILSQLSAGVFNLKVVGRTALEGLSQTVRAASCYGVGARDAKVALKAISSAFRA
jgi:hypothetical protein